MTYHKVGIITYVKLLQALPPQNLGAQQKHPKFGAIQNNIHI